MASANISTGKSHWGEGITAEDMRELRWVKPRQVIEVAFTEWTAGGLHAPTVPSANKPPACGVLLKLTAGKFERVTPEEPASFDCKDEYVAPVTGPVVDQAKLGPDRISTLFTK